MSEWAYEGYIKVKSNDGKRMIEQWIWKCTGCGYEIRKQAGNQYKPEYECPNCQNIRARNWGQGE